jgi:hypothetical protein
LIKNSLGSTQKFQDQKEAGNMRIIYKTSAVVFLGISLYLIVLGIEGSTTTWVALGAWAYIFYLEEKMDNK